MTNIAKAVLGGELISPGLELGHVDFNRGSTVATSQVMVVGINHAASVEALTPVGHHHVDVASTHELLQLGVHRRKRNMPAVALDQVVELLGAHEALHSAEGPDNLASLLGNSGGGHGYSVLHLGLQTGMILSNITGMVLKKLTTALALLLGVASVATSVAGASTPKISIVAGVSEWGALAQQLVGNSATVTSLLTDPNADPHEHEATVSDATKTNQASIVIVNGAGYDTWLSKLLSARSSSYQEVNVAKLMGVKVGANPHLFYDPVAASAMVRQLSSEINQVHPGLVAANEAVVLSQLAKLEAELQNIKSKCGGTKIAATEDVASYLLVRAGLDIVTPKSLRLAVGNGVDPSVQDLATALQQLTQHPAFLLYNTQTSTPLTTQLVAQAKASHVPVIDVTETLARGSYVAWMQGTINAISAALQKSGCKL